MAKEEMIDRTVQLQREADRVRRQRELDLWMDLPLTIAQLKSLFFICDQESATPGKLAAALRVTPTNITGIIDRLVKQEMVSRVEDPQDRRTTSLRTTRKGTDLVARLRSGRKANLNEVLKRMSPEDLEFLALGLEAFIKASEGINPKIFHSQ